MGYNQIYSVINAATARMLGASGITAINSTNFVDVGGQLLGDDGVNIPIFMDGLMGVLRETYIKSKKYNRKEKISARRDASDFGLYLRKIQRKNIQDVAENSSYKAQDWDYYDGSLTDSWDDRIFGKIAGYETAPIIVSDKKLCRCFHNEAEMAAFIDMLYEGMANDVEVHAETTEAIARATAMGLLLSNSTSNHTAVNLSTLYAAAYPEADAIDSSNWMYDANFIRFAIVQIKAAYRRMQTYNRIFNTEGADRFTNADELVVDIHADFVGAMEGYLENTLIAPFIALPNFNPVTRWMATGTTAAFGDDTAININNNYDASAGTGFTVSKKGVLACLHDIDLYALTIDDLRTVNARNSLQEMTTTVTKYDTAYAVDPSEQGIVFYVTDAV